MQNGLIERNAGLPPDRRIEFRVGVHLGDVVEETDGDLMGDGVNIAARLEGIAKPGAIALSEDAYRQVKGRLDLSVSDLGHKELKNIAEPIRVYSLEVGVPAEAKPVPLEPPPERSGPPRLSIVVLPFANLGGGPEQEHFVDGVTESLTTDLSRITNALVVARNTASTYKGKTVDAKQIGRELNVRYILEGSIQTRREPDAGQRAADRRDDRQSSVGRPVRQADRRSLRHAGRDRFPARQPVARRIDRRRGACGPSSSPIPIRSTIISAAWPPSTRAGSTI